MKIYYFTNVGKVRTNNEDGILIKCKNDRTVLYEVSLSSPLFKEEECFTFVVADGMGGTEKGDVATKVVLESLNKCSFLDEGELRNILMLAKFQLENMQVDGGCALAGVNIFNGVLFYFNVGDCRVYKKHRSYAKRISKDHSVVEDMVDAGLISMTEAHNHPKSNILTSSIMPFKDFEVFWGEEDVKKGNIYLICSDGVWGELSIDELDECFEHDNIEDINKNLFEKLSQKEQKDNLTYILLEI